MQRRSLIAAGAAALATTLPLATLAQPAATALTTWPSQPVKIIVPTGAGSSLDLIVRLLSQPLAARWGQPVVVDNKPGAGGMLGLDIAAKATDGHTIAIGFNGPLAYAPFLYAKTPYDPVRDLKAIVMTTSQANVLAVNAERVPAKTVAEFVAWAKAQGGKMNYSSLGQGSSALLTRALFLHEAGLQAQHVPFNGPPRAAFAVAQGTADATFMVAPALLPHVQSGKVRMLAVSASARPDSLRELPSLAEAGYPRVESLAWNGLVGPAALADSAVARINADVNDLLAKDAPLRDAMAKSGLSIVGGSAAEFRRFIDADVARWGPVITRLGVKLN
ncbi:MAG: tripartite tricarboxylate transporter substrate binding protein [Microbacteriaceae bacterium]|nr:tripartite tricarboxylate transporter substrate binding protein [Burkholderiaceae bacterium]